MQTVKRRVALAALCGEAKKALRLGLPIGDIGATVRAGSAVPAGSTMRASSRVGRAYGEPKKTSFELSL